MSDSGILFRYNGSSKIEELLRRLEEIDRENFSDFFSAEQFHREIVRENTVINLICCDASLLLPETFANEKICLSDICGYAIYYLNPWDKSAELIRIAVTEGQKNRGLGKKLLLAFFNRIVSSDNPLIKRIFLEVSVKNLAAIHLYRKNGFRQISLRRNYYANNDDAIIMEKTMESI